MNKMKRKILVKMVSVVFFLSLFGVFCNSTAAQSSHLSIVTAGSTGTYYAIGAALSKVFNEHVPNIFAVAEVSGGSIENIRLVSRGEADIGLSNQMHIRSAIDGKEPFDEPITNLRTVFPLAGTEFKMVQGWHLIVLENSPVKSIYDLKGKKVSVGTAGSGTEMYSKKIFDTLFGNGYDDIKPFYYSYSEATSAMLDGNIDACIFHTSMPIAAVVELATTKKLRMISLSPADIQKLIEENGFIKRVITPKIYDWLEEDVQTVDSTYAVVFCNKNANENTIYNITKAAIEYKEEIWTSNPGARGYDEFGVSTGLDYPPLHLGAYKYFNELGIDIPDKVIPPELN